MTSKAPRVLEINICHQKVGDTVVLDAINTTDKAFVFGVGDLIQSPVFRAGVDAQSVGGHGILIGADVLFPDIELSEPQTRLFQGERVLFGMRNGQSWDIISDWIDWHFAFHKISAVLIIDREPAGASSPVTLREPTVAKLNQACVVRFDHPLGSPSLPPETHPFCAPHAPGKDRMEVPPSDPWRSPLAQTNVLEIVRRRFLDEAEGVAYLDVGDLLERLPGPIFDVALNNPDGFEALKGHPVYPWRVRVGHDTHFSDHICEQFDHNKPINRWCVAPQITKSNHLWRPFYVPPARQEGKKEVRFFRCMGLRHDAESVSRIVPKSSLIENAELIEIAQECWDAKPVRQPKQKARSSGKDNSVAIVTCMKNEGPFILEWLAYHRVIGVESFLVYTNDCTDGTDTFLDLLQAKGLLQHRDNPFRESGLKPQHAALHAADDEPIMQNADWLICMDVDEFINVKVGDGHLRDLFKAVPNANMISLTWRLFGNSDIHAFKDAPIIQDFTRCAEEMTRKPHQAWGFKTLYRNLGIFKKLGVHRPKGLNPQLWEDINWVNGSGKPMPRSMFRNAWRSTKDTVGYDLVTLNHYAVRSAESFLVKRDRGRVNHVDRDQGLAYWFRMNHNLQEDRSIQRMLPALKSEMERLLQDPEIAAQHAACVEAHQAKIDELRATPNYSAFYQTLTGDRMQRLSRLLKHFGANVFLAGPDAVPDEIVSKDHPDTFFFTVERQETQH